MKAEKTYTSNEICRITKDTVIKGSLNSSSDIRIDGIFEGDLNTTAKVVVAETAQILGDIVCGDLDLLGIVKGSVYVNNVAHLKSTALFEGDLNTKKIAIEVGARFDGVCKMITDEEFEKVKTGK